MLYRVYPRVYGGTFQLFPKTIISLGLSPRVRGNLSLLPDCQVFHGSIPACTGEPDSKGYRSSQAWVYPRVYGGT